MAANDDLRKAIAKAYKSATNKMNRTLKTTGAKVAGSEFDPRKAAGAENRMRSTANMREYLGNLNAFNNRANQFVSGTDGAPLRKGYFNKIYKANERAVDAVRAQRDATMGDIRTPTGFTVRQQIAAVPQSGGSAVYGPYAKFDRQAINITSQAALEKLNADMVNRLKPNYLGDKINAGRDNIQKVADYLGESGIADQVSNLSDEEFDLLWFGTNYADRLFLYYEMTKERQDGNKKERKQDKVISSQFAGIGELIQWAKDPEKFNKEADDAIFKRQSGQIARKRGK